MLCIYYPLGFLLLGQGPIRPIVSSRVEILRCRGLQLFGILASCPSMPELCGWVLLASCLPEIDFRLQWIRVASFVIQLRKIFGIFSLIALSVFDCGTGFELGSTSGSQ